MAIAQAHVRQGNDGYVAAGDEVDQFFRWHWRKLMHTRGNFELSGQTCEHCSSSGISMPDDDEAVLTSSLVIIGSTMPPAKAVVAATDKAAASAIFFIVSSRI